MDPDKGPVATEAPPQSSASPPPAIIQPSVSVEALTEAARATQSLKRQREATPTSPNQTAATHPDPSLSPSKAARIINLTARQSPAPLTGAAAIEDEKRRKEEAYKQQVAGESENPAYKVQSELLSGGSLAMSRPEDAPAAASNETVPDNSAPDHAPTDVPTALAPAAPEPAADVNSQNVTTEAVLGNGAPPVTNSPPAMDVDARSDRESFGTQPTAQMEEKGGSSMSYPGMLQATGPSIATPVRGATMPVTGSQQSTPKSPNSKKHKCPYCETEFTRHHNLKSHLLTHSQEKPYVCQTCHMRFRRLHDLKRHGKLHTGEKPHVCPKCDRKFARGDALARHSKGPGGCVGRRSSMGGSFLGDDDLDGPSQLEGDSTMTDVVYDANGDVDMGDADRRRLSLSGVKAPHAQGGNISLPITGGNPSMYAQSGMTESPKPLSPDPQTQDSASMDRHRSPALAQLSQQARNMPPGYNVADAARYAASAASQANAAASQSGPSNSGAETAPVAGSLGQNGGSGDSATNNLFASDQGMWTYITSLEEQLRGLSDRVQVMESTERAQEEKNRAQEEINRAQEETNRLQDEKNRLQDEKIGFLTQELSALRSQIDAAKTIEAVEKTN